jgi:hypothetical protein
MNLVDAIARMEGYGVTGSRARRNNNPGNIEYGQFAISHGSTRIETAPFHGAARFAYFPTPEQGFAALKDLLLMHYGSLTVEDAINKYAPSSENNTTNYVHSVCMWVNCSPSDPVNIHLD